MNSTAEYSFYMTIIRFIAQLVRAKVTTGEFSHQVNYTDIKVRKMTPSVRAKLKTMALAEMVEPVFYQKYGYMRLVVDLSKPDNAVTHYKRNRQREEDRREAAKCNVVMGNPHVSGKHSELAKLLSLTPDLRHAGNFLIIPPLTGKERDAIMLDVINYPNKDRISPLNTPSPDLSPEEREKMIVYLAGKFE